MADIPFFYGLQPRWTHWDRLFKLYMLADSIAAAYVSGQVYDEESGKTQLVRPGQIAGPLAALWVRRIVRKRAERESRYESLLPGSREFFAADRRNFSIKGADIERILLSSRRAFWTLGAANSGSIQFDFWSGKKMRLILVDEQNIDCLNDHLSRCVRGVLIERKPTPDAGRSGHS